MEVAGVEPASARAPQKGPTFLVLVQFCCWLVQVQTYQQLSPRNILSRWPEENISDRDSKSTILKSRNPSQENRASFKLRVRSRCLQLTICMFLTKTSCSPECSPCFTSHVETVTPPHFQRTYRSINLTQYVTSNIKRKWLTCRSHWCIMNDLLFTTACLLKFTYGNMSKFRSFDELSTLSTELSTY